MSEAEPNQPAPPTDHASSSSTSADHSNTAQQRNERNDDGGPTPNEQHDSTHDHSSEDDKKAALIQKNYRGYKARRELDGLSLSPDTRWQDAITRLRLQQAHKQAESGKNDSVARWKRGGLLVGQLTGAGDKNYDMQEASGDEGEGSAGISASRGDGAVEGGPSLKTQPPSESVEVVDGNQKVGNVSGANEGGKIDNIRSIAKPNECGLRAIERWTRGNDAQELSKIMEAQYWLEMVDSKHRYGSNLKYYHAAWCEDNETDLNFFRWLDQGPGKELDLLDCPRERLDSERVIYLSAEQRKNYIVDIEDGKLHWRRNRKPVDTAKGKHRDLGEGRGIVDLGPDEQEEAKQQIKRRALERGISEDSLSSVMDGSSSSDDEEMSSKQKRDEARHYQSKRSGKKTKHLDALSPSNWADMLLRKTIGANTWIYVYNHRGELYIGLKQTGYFQHSSFLYGGRVLSAGLLRVDQGQLVSLSPLSGHYRAGSCHFRALVKALQDSQVDLSRVVLSKSLLLLKGMEKYGELIRKVKGGGGDGGGGEGEKEGTDKGGEESEEDEETIAQRIKTKLKVSDEHGKGDKQTDEEEEGRKMSKMEKFKDLLLLGHRKKKREEAASRGEKREAATV